MPKIIEIPNVGEVEFPDSMSETDIAKEAQKLYSQAKPIEPQPTLAGGEGISTDIYQDVIVPPEQVKLPSGEEEIKKQSERFNQAFLSGMLTVPSMALQGLQLSETNLSVMPQLKQEGIIQSTLAEDILTALPKPLSESLNFQPENATGFIETVTSPYQTALKSPETMVQFTGSMFSPESYILSPSKTFKKTPITPEDFEPIAAWRSKASMVEDKTLTPLLKQELQTALEEQAQYEAKLASQEAKISKQTGQIISKEINTKELAAQKIDSLAQDAAIATANKEAQIAKAQQKLSIFDNTIEDPTVFNDKVSALEAKRLQSQARLQVLDQEITMLDQTKDIDKISRLQGQMLSEQNRINEIIGEINDVNMSRGMSRDQRLLARQQIQTQINKAIQTANIAETKALGQLGKKAQKIAENLQIERFKLLKELEQKRKLRLDLTETSDKLRENLIKQEQIKQTLKQSPVKVFENLDWGRSFGSLNIPEQAFDVALKRTEIVDEMVKSGIIVKENAPTLKKAVFEEVLSANGIKPASENLTDWNLLTESYRWGKVQRKTGIPVGRAQQAIIWAKNEAQNLQNAFKKATIDPIRNLRKLGISADNQLELLQYFETLPDGSVQFNPNAFQYADPITGVLKVNIPTYAGPMLNPAQIQEFIKLRMLLDQAADTFKVPKLPRYVPIRELPQYINIPTKTSADAIRNPALAQARTTGSLVRGVHDTNILNVFDRYAREGARKVTLAPALENGVDALNMLYMSGLNKEADYFSDYLIKVFNLKDKRNVADILGSFRYDAVKDEVANFVKRFDDPENAAEQIKQAFTEAMYVKMIGANPKSIVKQFLQFPTMGMIELGPKWVASAAKDILSKARKLDATRILNASLVKDSAFFEKEMAKAPTNRAAKILNLVNLPYKAASKYTMEAGEKFNRLSSVIAAQNKFDFYWAKGGVSGIDELLKESALTTAQREMVSKAYIAGGVQNAKDAYALLMTQRMNFAYGVADAPKLFRDFGRLFPFMTYVRNILSRGAEALDEKKYGYFPKIILEPLVAAGVFSYFTGRTLPPGSMPIEAVTDIYERGVSTTPEIIGKNLYKIISPIPYTLWDEEKFKEEIDRQITVFPKIGESSPLYNKLFKGMEK